MVKIQTVCWIVKDGKVLLGAKKRGLNAGCWNGFGGKLEDGETPLECIKRETKEEAGIDLCDISELGIVKFHNHGLDYVIQVHFYKCVKIAGVPISTDEMDPKWFSVDKIPYANMWASDQHILPMVLKGQKFTGEFWFKADGSIRKFDMKSL